MSFNRPPTAPRRKILPPNPSADIQTAVVNPDVFLEGSRGYTRAVIEDDTDPNDMKPEFDPMPRGKTAADRCNSCFMIHSSNQRECE